MVAAASAVVSVVLSAEVNAAASVVVSVVVTVVAIVVNALLLVEATALLLHVAENILPARTNDVTETEIGSVTSMPAALAALSTVNETEMNVNAGKMIAVPVPMVTTGKVRLSPQTKTTLSCPGTEADTRISPRISASCSR